MAQNEVKLAAYIKAKFPGLSAKDIQEIIKEIRKDNDGKLTGLKMSGILGLVKKSIHERNRIREAKWKKERQEKNETCEICFQMFSQHGTRNRHMKVVHGTPVPSRDNTGFDKNCPHCKKKFKYDFSLSYHLESMHSDTGTQETHKTSKKCSPLFECKECAKVFKEQFTLNRHLKTHEGNSGFKCDRCTATFSRHDNLVKHEKRIHSIANINVSIIRKSNMTEFTCKMCGRNFGRDRSTFEAHLMLRLCRQIDKDNLEVDSNLKFVCDQCDKTYAEKDSLDRHIRWKHRSPMELFKCSQCDSTFKLKSPLARHSRRVHNGT